MTGRFFSFFAAFLATALCGCAGVSEDRIVRLESAVADLQATDMRLATLEDTVASLVAATKEEMREEMAQRSAPRGKAAPQARAGAVPVPAPAPSPAPASAPAPSAARTDSPAPKSSVPAGSRYQTALSTLESGKPQGAMVLFQEFLQEYPGDSLTPNALYWLGECQYTMKRYDAALASFKDVVAQYPKHDKAAAAMLKAGYSLSLLGDAAGSRVYFEALIRDFPASQPASLARTRMAAR